MRYVAEVLQDENDDTGYSPAVVAPAGPSEAIAARHARAMASVLRASKAWRRWQAKTDMKPSPAGAWDGLTGAHRRLLAAVARLEKVEKEVSRGSK
jgi:hypothetical protein